MLWGPSVGREAGDIPVAINIPGFMWISRENSEYFMLDGVAHHVFPQMDHNNYQEPRVEHQFVFQGIWKQSKAQDQPLWVLSEVALELHRMREDKRESKRTLKRHLGTVSLVLWVKMTTYCKHTVFHEARLHEKFFQRAIQWHALWVNNQAWRNWSPHWLCYVEVVRQSDALSFCDCFDLMLAVTIECYPLNRRRTLVTPVELDLFSLMLNDQDAPFEMRG